MFQNDVGSNPRKGKTVFYVLVNQFKKKNNRYENSRLHKKAFYSYEAHKNGRKGRMMMVEKVNIARALNLSCLLIS